MVTTEQPTPDSDMIEWGSADMIEWLMELGVTRAGATHSVDSFVKHLRAQIADELRELRPGYVRPVSPRQESFQRGYDAAVAQLDRIIARGAGRG